MQTQTKIALVVGAVILFAAIFFFSSSSGERENVPIDTKQPVAPTDARSSSSASRSPGATPGGTTPQRTTGRPESVTQPPNDRTGSTRQGTPATNRPTPSDSADRLATRTDVPPVRPAATDSTVRPAVTPAGAAEGVQPMRGPADAREASVDADADRTTRPTLTPGAAGATTPTVTERTVPSAASTAPPTSPTVGQPLTTPATKMQTHVVVEGDTFSTLALKYYGSQRYTGQLIQANPQVSNPNMLKLGMKLNVPELGQVIPAPSGTEALAVNQYRVRSGDSFASIARDKLGDERRWPELYEINKDRLDGGPDSIKPGIIIYLSEPKSQ